MVGPEAVKDLLAPGVGLPRSAEAAFSGHAAVRSCEPSDPRDVGVAVSILRRNNRWRAAGLAKPPDQDALQTAVDVLWPGPVARSASLRVSLAFDCRPKLPHLVAAFVDYGLADPDDRTRCATAFFVDLRPAALELADDIFQSFVQLASLRRLHALVAPKPGVQQCPDLSDFMEKSLKGAPLSQAGQAFVHARVPATDTRIDLRPSPQCPTRLSVSEADRRQLQAFGKGGWPATPTRHVGLNADTEIIINNPAIAHRHLIQGLGPLRRSAFPEAGPPETVDVLIVGAGVSGLAAAFRLKPRKCTVLERASQIGGTGAAAVSLSGQQFALAAHYECNLSLDFGKEVLDIYRDLGIVEPRPGTNSLGFVDRHHHVDPARSEQAILTDGTLRTRGWRMFASDPVATRFKDRLLQQAGDFCLPTRLSPERAKDAQRRTFRAWLTAEGFESGTELERSMNILLKSDYGADAALVNAYAGLHYFLCRPYFTTGTETFSPPQGLQYFADKLLAATPGLDLRLETLVVRLVPHADHVEVVALDVGAKRTRRFRARAVVFAAPKKVLKYVYPPDRALFAANRYAAWITVTFELKETFPETELLAWANHVPERSGVHVGFSWANHHTPDQPPIITHYLALPPGKLSHFEVLLARPGPVVKRCLELMAVLFGRDLGAITRRVTLQKLGHSMPTPVVGSLFTDPNRHRACPRIAYAGVDTGRLPVLAEAFDSALDAVAAIREV